MSRILAGCLLAAAAVAFGGVACAQEPFDYSYVEVDYLHGHVDVPGVSATATVPAYGIGASYAVHERAALQATYVRSSTKFDASMYGLNESYSADSDGLSLGISVHRMIGEVTELGLDIARNRTRTSATAVVTGAGPAQTFSMTAVDYNNTFDFRLRSVVAPALRVFGSVGTSMGGNAATSTDYSIGVEYELSPRLEAGGGYLASNSSDGNSYGFIIGARWHY